MPSRLVQISTAFTCPADKLIVHILLVVSSTPATEVSSFLVVSLDIPKAIPPFGLLVFNRIR